jgi:hypothetical protein
VCKATRDRLKSFRFLGRSIGSIQQRWCHTLVAGGSFCGNNQYHRFACRMLILQFPLWWFSMPAILKGWIDRVFAYGVAAGARD